MKDTLSKKGKKPLIIIESDIMKRETRNSFHLPKHSYREGRVNRIMNVTKDHEAKINPVI